MPVVPLAEGKHLLLHTCRIQGPRPEPSPPQPTSMAIPAPRLGTGDRGQSCPNPSYLPNGLAGHPRPAFSCLNNSNGEL